jgi:hypothetical protein
VKIKLLVSMAALLSFTTTLACTQAATPSLEKHEPAMLDRTVAGSYIVKVSGDGELVIRRIFAKYGVALVRSLGNEQFEMQLKLDPGIDTIKSMAAGSDGAVTAVQPNFIYHSN